MDKIGQLLADNKQTRPTGDTAAAGSPRDDRAGREPEPSRRPALEIDEEPIAGEPREPRQGRDKSLADYAEEKGLSPKDIYGLKIDLGIEGESPKTVSELKDAYQANYRESREFQRTKDEFEDDRAQSLNDIHTARQQVESVLEKVMQLVPPERFRDLFQDEQRRYLVYQDQERKKILEFFPDWKDAVKMTEAREAIVAHLATYGWTAADVGRMDARQVKYVHDSMKLRERYERLKSNYQVEHKPSTEPPSTRRLSPETTADKAARMAARGDKYGAIGKLLEGSMQNGHDKSRR
jgi:hypothetical protein